MKCAPGELELEQQNISNLLLEPRLDPPVSTMA